MNTFEFAVIISIFWMCWQLGEVIANVFIYLYKKYAGPLRWNIAQRVRRHRAERVVRQNTIKGTLVRVFKYSAAFTTVVVITIIWILTHFNFAVGLY